MVYFYLVRPWRPREGSWGQDSSLMERTEVCGAETCSDGLDNDADGLVDCDDLTDCFSTVDCPTATFQFVDTAADNVAPQALEEFFAALRLTASHWIHFSLGSSNPVSFEWCAQQANFYRDSYRSLAAGGGNAASGGWSVWHRTDSGAWIGPLVDNNVNYYGSQCFGAYSWCSETGLAGRGPTVDPNHVVLCEARDAFYGCGDGTWTLSISVGVDRLAACGF